MKASWTPRGDGAALLEAIHRPDLADPAWLDGLWQTMKGLLPDAKTVMAGIATWKPGVDGLDVSCVRATLPEEAQRVALTSGQAEGPSLERMFAVGRRVSTFREVFSRPQDPPELARIVKDLGIADFLNVQCSLPRADERLASVVVCSISETQVPLPDAARAAWERFASHLTAAVRIRLFGVRAATEGVLSPDGRLLHAEGDAREPSAQEALRRAVVAIERARRADRRTDVGSLLDAWRAIYENRWTVVETVESDGKRLLLARVNAAVGNAELDALTPREREVAALLAEGASQREVAYDLAISTSTVAGHVRAIARKLGAATSTELVRRLGRLEPPA